METGAILGMRQRVYIQMEFLMVLCFYFRFLSIFYSYYIITEFMTANNINLVFATVLSLLRGTVTTPGFVDGLNTSVFTQNNLKNNKILANSPNHYNAEAGHKGNDVHISCFNLSKRHSEYQLHQVMLHGKTNSKESNEKEFVV
jgi:hypothetical protein